MFNPEFLEVQADWCSACSGCSAAVVCLADGPIPDFEFGAVAGVSGLVGW